MWLIDRKTFDTDQKQCEMAFQELQSAAKKRELTLVVGNGASRAAVLLHSPGAEGEKAKQGPVGWGDAVKKAAEKAEVTEEFYNESDINLLALAEAVVVRLREEGHDRLLKEFQTAFEPKIPPTLIHEILCDLAPRSIVTTNYDFQLERAFAERGDEWRAVIRNVEQCASDGTQILKMHGTLKPPEELASRYTYPDEKKDWTNSPQRSVVISESDYDSCMDELQQAETNVLLDALKKPCLILGKSFEWQDLSFLYALRKTRAENRIAYALMTSLNKEEKLNLDNLGIKPLLINMPVQRKPGHYYVALVKALLSCFSTLIDRFSEYENKINDFSDREDQRLRRRPAFVAVGLASHNTIGRVIAPGGNKKKGGRYEIPLQGVATCATKPRNM